MKVGQVCKRNLITIRKSDELTTAARLMRDKHIGYLIVVESNPDKTLNPVGVLTDRDIVVAVIAKDTDPRALTVGDVMTVPPVVVAEGLPISSALKEMRRIGVRRLPVVGSAGQLTGVLSLDDVLDTLAEELFDAAGSIRKEVLFEKSLRP